MDLHPGVKDGPLHGKGSGGKEWTAAAWYRTEPPPPPLPTHTPWDPKTLGFQGFVR